MSTARHLNPVSIDNLPEYPLDPDLRLDSHGFIQWESRRWIASGMRWYGSHDCKSMWFELLNLAHSETPVGTLPTDMGRLSQMIRPTVEQGHFENLCKLEYGPLHGWILCRCGDEVRYMHPVVTRIVISAFASRANHAARVEAASTGRRLSRLTEDVAAVAPKIAGDPRKIRWIDRFIQDRVEQRGGQRRTPQEFHAAIQECLAEAGKGRFPDKET